MAAETVFVSLPPAKTVTRVELRGTNGTSCSMKFPGISRPYCLPSAWKPGLITAAGIPRLLSVTVEPIACSCRTMTGTYPIPSGQEVNGTQGALEPTPAASLAPMAV